MRLENLLKQNFNQKSSFFFDREWYTNFVGDALTQIQAQEAHKLLEKKPPCFPLESIYTAAEIEFILSERSIYVTIM